MSRDYRPVVIKDGKKVFKNGDSWNVNVWGAEFWGYFFKELGLPTEPTPASDTCLPHNITGELFRKYKEALGKSSLIDFERATRKSYELINEHRWKNEPVIDVTHEETQGTIEEVMNTILPMFLAKDHVGVASDYCSEFYEGEVE